MMTDHSQIVLSLFPGIGLLDRAFEEVGFCVVRGPDLLWGGDIKKFHPPAGRFDGIIGGPPCQLFSRLQALVAHNRKKHPEWKKAENLIPEFERCVAEARPRWFLMENVPNAPEPVIDEYGVSSVLVNNRWVGGTQSRLRKFCFGTKDGSGLSIPGDALEPVEYTNTVTASGTVWMPSPKGGRPAGQKNTKYFKHAVRAQGLPEGWDLPGFKVEEKIRALGNGVPLPLGRAVAKAVRAATT